MQHMKHVKKLKLNEAWSDYGVENSMARKKSIEIKIDLEELRKFVLNDPKLNYGGNPDTPDVLDSVERYIRLNGK